MDWRIIAFLVAPVALVSIVAGIVRATRRFRGSAAPAPPLSSRKAFGGGPVLIVFGGIFLAAGLAVLFFVFVRPALVSWRAQGWPHVRGVVTHSQLRSAHSNDGDDTYAVEIFYRYTVDGHAYDGNRYDTTVGSSSGRSGKQEVVSNHPVANRSMFFMTRKILPMRF